MVMTRFQKENETRSGEHLTVRREAGDLERRRPPQAEETKVKLESDREIHTLVLFYPN